ncbi:MAG: DUF4097 family beta strand repeat-containing protein [Myxococcales bacterium]|nr:DUF4097 family beta strand repeat-containing protein [Myxococcales bacterium]
MSERDETTQCGGHSRRGLGDFLRSLLSGIPWSEKAEEEESIRLDAPRGGTLRIDNANGRTRVVGEDRDDIQVEMKKVARAESEDEAALLLEEIRLVTREDDEFLLVEFDIPGRWNRKGRVDIELRVPRKLRVEVLAANGRICLEDLCGHIRAKSSNGPIRITNVVGDISVATSNAKVKTDCTCGRLTARCSNGKIQVDQHRGSVDASTSNGTINCELAELGDAGILLATSNGRISLELPEDVDGDVDIRVDNGVIRTGREFDGSATERSGRVKGTLGRGGIPIKLRASNGTVSLR